MNKNIDVLYIDPQSSTNLYIYAYRLLTNIGLSVLCVCSSYYDYFPFPDHVRQAPIISYNRYSNKYLQGLSFLCSYVRILYFIMRFRPRIIHLQWLKMPKFEILFYRLLKCFLGFRLVFTAHNLLPHDSGSRYVMAYKKWYALVDAIIVHTNDTKTDMMDQFGIDSSKINVIAHGLLDIQESVSYSSERLHELDLRYNLDGNLVFSSLGAQSFYKGVDLLVDIWSATPELNGNPHLKFVLVGPNKGVDTSALRNVENVIVSEERIPNDEFCYLLSHTDVYLLPYRSISQSGALLTAISAHIPVLATTVGGLKDPFSHGQIGWQLTDLSRESLKSELLYLARHPEEVRKVKGDVEMWSRVCAYYDWKSIGAQTEQLYRTLQKG